MRRSPSKESGRPVGAEPSPASRRGYIRTVRKVLPRYDYEHYSRLAGPLTQPDSEGHFRLQYRRLIAQEPHRVRAALMLAAAPLLSITLVAWLVQPEHWASTLNAGGWDFALRISMVAAIALIEGTRAVGVLSGAVSTLVARDPVPVVPKTGLRLAFLTTCVPGREPLEMVRATLEAAVRVRHRGELHVWLLDEGDDPELRLLCERLGVNHFSRQGVIRWNQRSGPNRMHSKHGNYNAWLEEHGHNYEFLASVDTDHIPLPNYLERILGYFRDEDVAFVSSPQVYGNNDSWITRAAESQQYLFHAVTQRAGNQYGAPMLVGTNNVIRIKALKGVGGFHDSITEDLATSLAVHRSRNPDTGSRWRSVYTPDVLAVGEGPNNWTDYFTQQLRWSRGTYEAIVKQLPLSLFSLSPGRLFHYLLMLAFYPLAALNLLLSAASCFILVWLGTGSIDVDPGVWLMLYGNASALQIGLYIWNRRHNVSPHEPEGSGGVAGMVMSVLASPIYLRAAFDTLLRRSSHFVVTPKGDSASNDTIRTFRQHLVWAALFGVTALYGALQGGTAGTVGAVWSFFGLINSILAPALWITTRYRTARAIRRGRDRGRDATKVETHDPNEHPAESAEAPTPPTGSTRSGRQRA
ncbi:glycosyltransferase family 2 protein [Streptomyces geranii]|uniref:glycosyltransferase family 2 protein n=1 Tax=Streptomyces geranii TaxID=2058923 RepID=UPI0038CD5177